MTKPESITASSDIYSLYLQIAGVILFAFGSFTGIAVLLSAGAICGGGSQGAASCLLPWPDPRLSIAFLIIGAVLLIAGTAHGWGRRHGGLAASALSIVLLVLGSGWLELGLSTLSVYVFSSSWLLYSSFAEIGVGIFFLVLGTRHWRKLERRPHEGAATEPRHDGH